MRWADTDSEDSDDDFQMAKPGAAGSAIAFLDLDRDVVPPAFAAADDDDDDNQSTSTSSSSESEESQNGADDDNDGA